MGEHEGCALASIGRTRTLTARCAAPRRAPRSAGRGLAVALLCTAAAAALAAAPQTAAADARSDYLVRLLTTSDQFRVRAQAALALGRLESADASVTTALTGALRDEHPAVRAAAAASLESRRDPSAIPALQAAARDRDASVKQAVQRAIATLQRLPRAPAGAASSSLAAGGAASGGGAGTSVTSDRGPAPSGPVRFYVGVATPASTSGLSAATLGRARELLVQNLRAIDGVEVAPPNESNAAARSVIERRRLVGFYVDCSITLEERAGGIRAAVNLNLNTYPGRDMRAILQGAATVPGEGTGEATKQRAIEAAIASAARRLPQAMEASGGVARAR